MIPPKLLFTHIENENLFECWKKLKDDGIIGAGLKGRVVKTALEDAMRQRGISRFSAEQLWKRLLYVKQQYQACKDNNNISGRSPKTKTTSIRLTEFLEKAP